MTSASAIVDKIKDVFNFRDVDDGDEWEDTEDLDDGVEEVEDVRENRLWGRRGKVVSMPQTQAVKMVVLQPTTFEQSEDICNLLKERQSVILNTEYISKDVARRMLDFVTGATYALDGHYQKISNSIFLFAPHNYEITNDSARDEIKSKFSFGSLGSKISSEN